MPSSVSSGFPLGIKASVKNRGVHSEPCSLREVAFSRWRSSNSCLIFVAWLYCLVRMASVTPCQKRRLSLVSCWVSGGMILGMGQRGLRSISSCDSCGMDSQLIAVNFGCDDPLRFRGHLPLCLSLCTVLDLASSRRSAQEHPFPEHP